MLTGTHLLHVTDAGFKCAAVEGGTACSLTIRQLVTGPWRLRSRICRACQAWLLCNACVSWWHLHCLQGCLLPGTGCSALQRLCWRHADICGYGCQAVYPALRLQASQLVRSATRHTPKHILSIALRCSPRLGRR